MRWKKIMPQAGFVPAGLQTPENLDKESRNIYKCKSTKNGGPAVPGRCYKFKDFAGDALVIVS